MSVEARFLIATLSTWMAWALVLRFLYLGLQFVIRSPGLDSARTLRRVGVCALFAALGFLGGHFFMPALSQSQAGGLGLPLFWLSMPFSGWMAMICALLSLYWIGSLLIAGQRSEESRAVKNLLLFSSVSFLAFWLFRGDEAGAHVIRGRIEFSAGQAAAMLCLAVAGLAAIVLSQRAAKAHRIFSAVAAHMGLVAGSAVFGLPFAWLLITSFKEDRDMSSPNGIVWIPRVQQTVPYEDPDNPLIQSEFQGTSVQGSIVEKYTDGSAKLDILKPMSMRGMTFVAHPPLKAVPREIPLVTGTFEGVPIAGKVVKEMEDGRRLVEVTQPKSLSGKRYAALNADVQPIRKVGLKFQNYPEALEFLPPEASKGLVYLKNTLIIVIFSVIGTILSSSLVAYAFARMRFPGKKALFVVLLSTMMLPAAVTLLPTFLIFRTLGWVDTLLPLWVPAFFGSAFNIFLLRQFFLTVPMELEDASKMDGCGYLRTFWQVMLPQVKPALAVVAIWTFMGAWNNFMGPLVYISSPENMTVSYALQLYNSERTGEPGYLMAFATMSIVPVLALFFLAQKYFIEGVQLSGLGGK